MSRYIRKDLKPLETNPFSGLIDAYVNSRAYVPDSKYETIEYTEEVPYSYYEYRWVTEQDWLLNSTLMKEKGWRWNDSSGTNIQLVREVESTKTVEKQTTVEIERYGSISSVPSMPDRPDLYVQDENGKWILNQTIWDEESQSWIPKGEFNPMFIYQPGYTLDYNSMVAFRIPEFFSIHKAITYYMWQHDPNTIGYLYIYPMQDSWIPDLIEVPSLIYNNAILWSMYDNIAFYNEMLFEDTPRGKLVNGSYYNVDLSFYHDVGQIFHTKWSNQKVCNSLDDLPDDLHPLKGKFTTQTTNLFMIAWVYSWFSRIARPLLSKLKAKKAAQASAEARAAFFNKQIPPAYVGTWRDYYSGVYRQGDASFGKLKPPSGGGQTFF